jgi:hypothetical protein
VRVESGSRRPEHKFLVASFLSFGPLFLRVVFFLWILVWIFAGAHPGSIFELPDQRTQVFLVLIALMWLFPEHVHKMFGEMPFRN